MQFSANPKPTEGFWTINKTKVPIAGADENGKYTSGGLEQKVKKSNLGGIKICYFPDNMYTIVKLSTYHNIIYFVCLIIRTNFQDNGKLH